MGRIDFVETGTTINNIRKRTEEEEEEGEIRNVCMCVFCFLILLRIQYNTMLDVFVLI